MEGVTFHKANELRMLANYDLVDKLKESHGEKVTYVTIGTAGEMRMGNSTICVTDPECRPDSSSGRGRGRGRHGVQGHQGHRA